MSFRSTLATFEHQLVVAGYPVAQYWNAGLEAGTVRDLFAAAGVVPTPELLALYTWKNGQSYEGGLVGELWVGAPGVFYPLEMAIEEYALNQKEHFYEPHFFPLFDDTLLLNLDPQSPHHGRLYRWCPSLLLLTPERMYDSLEAMLATLTACFAQGVYWYNADGYFDYDMDAEGVLAKALNPHATYWQAEDAGNTINLN
ncbi:SMI1/KNR4 family protein [Hymenobacter yonginensis]|uniref:Knr4/Smi1-like domain-containing protein n=1 Tax=Hymenobacter yonginensis TaxID=748197 RepID=A0ABY7PUX6_9BACT|nr:hypothetical protein [Hymenobacter yonginensis]WBO86721.1 hypothetical protein O9Z63_20790 [Hymenobacter yonginensis]